MPFAPDIIVSTEDTLRILLVAEAKLSRRGKEDESQLKNYMLHMRCPVGILVTPNEIEVFRDTYTAHSESSVEHVASFRSPKSWDVFKAPHHGMGEPELSFRFEQAVKSWLEQLGASPSTYLDESPNETREVLTDYVIPAVIEGVVRSTGPHESLTSH